MTINQKMRNILIGSMVILLFTSFPANASDKWDTTDKTMFITSSMLLAVDWRQTKRIAENPDDFRERNPILGSHPSKRDVNRYFFAAVIGNYLMADLLPSSHRKLWLGGVIIGTVGCVGNNLNIGLGIRW